MTPRASPSRWSDSDLLIFYSILGVIIAVVAYFQYSWLRTWVDQMTQRALGNIHNEVKLEKTHRTLSKWLTAFQVFSILALLGGVGSLFSSQTSQGILGPILRYFPFIFTLLTPALLYYTGRWSSAAFRERKYSNDVGMVLNLLKINIVLSILSLVLFSINAFTRSLTAVQIIVTLVSNVPGIYYFFVQGWVVVWIKDLSTLKKPGIIE